jgi:hypothetical protein
VVAVSLNRYEQLAARQMPGPQTKGETHMSSSLRVKGLQKHKPHRPRSPQKTQKLDEESTGEESSTRAPNQGRNTYEQSAKRQMPAKTRTTPIAITQKNTKTLLPRRLIGKTHTGFRRGKTPG